MISEIQDLKDQLDKVGDEGSQELIKKRITELETLLNNKTNEYNELLPKHQSLRQEYEEARRQASVGFLI